MSTACWPMCALEARSWREEEVEALGARRERLRIPLERGALPARLVMERERSVAILAVADGIVAVDREGGVVLWNAAAEEITDVPASGRWTKPRGRRQRPRSGPLPRAMG